ncbi:mechanosensitive ion channel family protein [Rhizobium sp. CSW-27]|uniref:mechanosensitive ion channel family protein n=1 Tax=Rhizobium sp. CSW-27 TaxID=2839985 RepID=UPI001C02F5A8|nr:mechanosensitive ion channel family protein [Rhizobium sp. CSW-27]MBT9372230.1 mechanosensitive ion channel [Rhizobium sp. CSW-27]
MTPLRFSLALCRLTVTLFLACLLFETATGRMARAEEAQVIIRVLPGQSEADIEAAVKAAGNRPVQLEFAAPAGVEAMPAAAQHPASTAATAPAATPAASPAPAAAPAAAGAKNAAAPPAGAPAAAAAAATDARGAPVVAMNDMWMVADVWDALAQGTQRSIDGLAGLPAAFRSSWQTLQGDDHGPVDAVVSALIAAGIGLALAFVLHRALAMLVLPHVAAKPAWRGITWLLFDAVGVIVYLSVAHAVLRQLLTRGMFSHQVAMALVSSVAGVMIYMAIGRLAFRPPFPGHRPLIPIARPNWHFAMLAIYGALNAFIGNSVRLADIRMLEPAAADSWLFLSSTVLTIFKLWWFIAGRQDIARVFAGQDAGQFRRAVGTALADFYIVSAVIIWLAGLLVAGTAQNTVWARAAGITQFLIVMIPILDLAIVSLLGHFARKREAASGPGLPSVILWSLRTPFAGAVWLTGLHLIVDMWQPLMMGASTLVTGWLLWLERISLALIVSWSLCSFLMRYFEAIAPSAAVIMPGMEDEGHKRETSRLTTVLPVVRNLILGAVIAIAGLVVVSSAGIDVAPLLAGFGVLGLALSFGSQTLVKDVVSGIFFLAEDAFRIGEYIDTGKLMGTVEQISLRSLRLRHHNGPIHTIPFGQISSVTNYSRDWGTTKFNLRFDRDADVEVIRKTAKKVGQSLLEHPEFGEDFLVPVKMQGIFDVNETSMVIRFKFTARPGKPSLIKREAMKRLLAAFKDAGVPLASNAVVVRSGSGGLQDGGAAATVVPLAAHQG